MTDTITVDLDRAKQLVEDAAQTWPERVDTSGVYFNEITGDCMCVVGAVLESLGKKRDDLHIKESTVVDTEGLLNWEAANYVGLGDITVDGIELTPEALTYLDAAMNLNDSCVRWGDIPAGVDAALAEAEL